MGVDYEEEWREREERGEYLVADSVRRVDSSGLSARSSGPHRVWRGWHLRRTCLCRLDTGSYPASFRELVYGGRIREHAFASDGSIAQGRASWPWAACRPSWNRSMEGGL